MAEIQDQPATLPCSRCEGRGRIWRTSCTIREIVPRMEAVRLKTAFYYENTDVCPECKGTGQAHNPEIRFL